MGFVSERTFLTSYCVANGTVMGSASSSGEVSTQDDPGPRGQAQHGKKHFLINPQASLFSLRLPKRLQLSGFGTTQVDSRGPELLSSA